jgi:hypothetical protein
MNKPNNIFSTGRGGHASHVFEITKWGTFLVVIFRVHKFPHIKAILEKVVYLAYSGIGHI